MRIFKWVAAQEQSHTAADQIAIEYCDVSTSKQRGRIIEEIIRMLRAVFLPTSMSVHTAERRASKSHL